MVHAAPRPRDMTAEHSFDERAATWDDNPEHTLRAAAVARCIIDAVPLERSMRVLEYGAGTGLVTQTLRDRVGPVTLADTSSGMRAVIQAKIDAGALGSARVWDVDLATEAPPDEQFDLIVTVMTLHHIPDLGPVLAAFARLLAPSGRLCIVDLDHEDGSFHGHDFGGHHGFERAPLARAIEQAGFTDVAFADCHEMERDGSTYPLFLATCTAATTAVGRGPEAGTP